MASYSKRQVDRAGNVLRNETNCTSEEVSFSKSVLTYWRYIHLPVINTFQAMLRNKTSGKSKKVGGFVAQRLKRTPSIIYKLNRVNGMRLCRMQDIAGIRAVVKKLSDVYVLSNEIKNSKHNHELIDSDDYIQKPKDSGYRSIHLVFRYNNTNQPASNGLQIEVQIRTRLQHIWSTSVETLGTFLNISLKSGEGDPDILDFFAVCSSSFAIIEHSPIIPKHHIYSSPHHLFEDVVVRYDALMIYDKLTAYSIAAQEAVKAKKAKLFLIILDTAIKRVQIAGYPKRKVEQANIDYTNMEIALKDDPTKEVVLVSIDKISALKNAYPNYFLEAKDFIGKIEALREIVTKNKNNPTQLSFNF